LENIFDVWPSDPGMKILTFATLFPNAKRLVFGQFVFERTSHLAARAGNLIRVVAPVPYFPSWIPSKRWGTYSQIPREETVGNLETIHPRYPLAPGVMPLHGLFMFLGTYRAARRLQREYHFDCIDAHYVYPDGFAAVLLGKALHLPVVVSARGTDINVFPSFALIRPMIRWTLRRAAGVIAVSAALKNAITDLGVPADKTAVIPNGVNVERFGPIERAVARDRLGLPRQIKIVVSVGSLTGVKNHHLLISAFARSFANRPDIRLYVLGEGPLLRDLQDLIHKLGGEQQMFLMGMRPNEELANWFNAADLSCLASSREGWPNVVMESLACGTPVVATRVGGIPEIITSEELGILVEQNIDSLATGLELGLRRDWNRAIMASHAQARSWDQVASEVEKYLTAHVVRRVE
jgi:teichuronic acid biosynthesis glycosyltransferase TuaC